MMLIFAAILVLGFLNSILVDRIYRILPVKELRRRARSGTDKEATALYKVMVFGPALEISLWFKGTFCATILLIWAARTSWLLALITSVFIAFMVVAGRSSQTAPDWQLRYVAWVAPLIAKILDFLQPLLRLLSAPLQNRRPEYPPTKLYEKEDLLELLKAQEHQSSNRLSQSELAIVSGALTFGDKLVGRIMTPRAKLKLVAGSDSIGPTLMDELHKTGQSRFIVVKEVTKAADLEILGTLFIKDLLDGLEKKGRVLDIMHGSPRYINESQDLGQALDAFIKTHQHLLVVVNNFEEIVGALSIEQVVEQVLGQKISGEFDRYDNLSAVAGLEKDQISKNHNEVDIAPKEK